MKKSLLQMVIDYIFGHKYYLPIYVYAGTFKTCTSATPFYTKRAALESTMGLSGLTLVEIISFRSRSIYADGLLK